MSAKTTAPPVGEIYQRLADAMGEVRAIGKERKNQKQNYMFRGIDDAYNALQPVLAKHGIVPVPQVLSVEREERPSKQGGVLICTLARIRYTFYAPDGSSVEAEVLGEGMDSYDKSANKAMAGAQKYALLQVFMVPTEEPKDSEHDSPEPARRQRKASEDPEEVKQRALGALEVAPDVGSVKKVVAWIEEKHPALADDIYPAAEAAHERIKEAEKAEQGNGKEEQA